MSETKKDLMIPITATAIELYEGDALEAVLAKIEEKARKHVPDISTQKGRDAIRTNAAKVTSSRTYLFQLGKDLTEERRDSIKATNAVRNQMEERLKELNTEVRKPLTDFEEEEKKREAIAVEAMDRIKELGNASLEATSEELEARLVELKDIKVDDSFGDHENVASIEKEKSIEKLEAAIVTVKRREAEQLELEQMRKDKEKREIKEAEEKAKKERLEREAKVRKEATEKAQREAKEKADRGKAEAKEREEKLKREKVEAEKRERETIEKAAREKKELEERLEREKEQAAQDERDRIAAENKAVKDAADKRERDNKHKAKINNAVVSGLVQVSGIKEAEAKAIVTSIAKGEIPHVRIQY